MKLLKLSIKDFQAHEEFEIDFSPTITTIQGATDKGKSSVLRALRWICLNDFAGDDFVRDGAKRAGVMLVVRHNKENHELARIRGSGSNTYTLNGEEFKSFATSVPEPIVKLLSLSELNFQGQHDAPFWFSLSAPEVSRRLNSVIDLSLIDTSLSNIGNEVRRSQERVILCEERLADYQKRLEDLKPQAKRVSDFARLLESEKAFRLLEKQRFNLCSLLKQIDDWKERSASPPSFEPVQKAHKEWKRLQSEHAALEYLLSGTEGMEDKVRQLQKEAKEAEQLFHNETKGKECPLCGNLI